MNETEIQREGTSVDGAAAAPNRHPVVRIVRAVLVVAAILGGLRLVHWVAREPLAALVSQIPADEPWAPWVMLVVAAVGTCVLVPGSILSIAAGFTFGFAEGVLVAGVGTWLGALGCFGIGRTVGGARMQRYIDARPRLRRFSLDAAKQGTLLVFLTRLSPLAPSTAMNYAFSALPIRTSSFALGSIGLLPNVAMYTYLGSIGHDALESPSLGFDHWIEWSLASAWILSSGALLGWLVRWIRRHRADPPVTQGDP